MNEWTKRAHTHVKEFIFLKPFIFVSFFLLFFFGLFSLGRLIQVISIWFMCVKEEVQFRGKQQI